MVMSEQKIAEQAKMIEQLEARVERLENIIDRMRDATLGIKVNSIPISQKRIDDTWGENRK
ncbi:MAG: hypothetical protein CM15mV29_0360 [uncultured marine virus]|jgi:outer membrane murein-binding lipoprotein Lpp|nr:MAG: hypothetical protein CM15mV29_0360 [uncultured marine virus]